MGQRRGTPALRSRPLMFARLHMHALRMTRTAHRHGATSSGGVGDRRVRRCDAVAWRMRGCSVSGAYAHALAALQCDGHAERVGMISGGSKKL